MALQRVKQFKDIEIEYESVAAMSVIFLTDMPGTAMAIRATLAFPLTTTRRTLTLPLDGIEGTLFQVKITSTGIVRLYGGVVRVKPIGVYFDGGSTPAEFWSTQEQGIGV